MYKRFDALKIDKCPFANLPEKRRTMWALTASEMKECHWLKQELVAQIEFTEWTPDAHLRHASFAGLRDDKEARQIRRRRSASRLFCGDYLVTATFWWWLAA